MKEPEPVMLAGGPGSNCRKRMVHIPNMTASMSKVKHAGVDNQQGIVTIYPRSPIKATGKTDFIGKSAAVAAVAQSVERRFRKA